MIMDNFEDIALTKDELNFLKELSKKDEVVLTNNEVRLYKAFREEELIRISFTQSRHIFKITTRGKNYLKFLKHKERKNIISFITFIVSVLDVVNFVVKDKGIIYTIFMLLRYILNLLFN